MSKKARKRARKMHASIEKLKQTEIEMEKEKEKENENESAEDNVTRVRSAEPEPEPGSGAKPKEAVQPLPILRMHLKLMCPLHKEDFTVKSCTLLSKKQAPRLVGQVPWQWPLYSRLQGLMVPSEMRLSLRY